ncbi:MAG: aldo/keto reductase [Chloroflexota bacterium]
MEKFALGKTGLMVAPLGLGGVPIQRPPEDEAIAIIRRCLDLGMNYIDTAAEYSTSEARIGQAIAGRRREDLVIATKANYGTREEMETKLRQSLKSLGVSYIDLYQFHLINTPELLAKAIDPAGPLGMLLAAKKAGIIRHIGVTSHHLEVAREAVKTGVFETVLFPFNFVTDEPETQLLPLARERGVGFIAMKPFAGGALKCIGVALKYLLSFPDVLSIPGVQELREVEEIMQIAGGPRGMTEAEKAEMRRVKAELDSELCRRCAHCEPCPEGVPVLHLMDLMPFVWNMPPARAFREEIAANIEKFNNCNQCGECETKCDYGIPVMKVIADNYRSYQEGLQQFRAEGGSR